MNYIVDAVREALSVLMLVSQTPGLGVTELAKRSGNTKARTFRLLCTLEQDGFVQRGPSEACYVLGPASLVLGLAAQEQVTLARIASRHLRELGEQFNEDVQIRVRDGLMSVAICKWESSQGVRVHTQLGSRRPLHAGASSKVLLAYAPEEIFSSIQAAESLIHFTERTLIDKEELTQEIRKIRHNGYAVSFGEVDADIVAIAVPIFDAEGTVAAALGMSIPSSRAPTNLKHNVTGLKAAALRISQDLGWNGLQNQQ